MSTPHELIVWHGPNTRSTGTVWLVEELGVPYELRKVDVFGGETREAEFLKVNPAGKVPAIRYHGRTLTEMAAISLYLCDEFPDAGLAPAIGDELRADYLYWSVFRPGILEPAIVTKAQNLEVDPRTVGWGEWETVIGRVETTLENGPYLLGERFSAADILVGGALGWMKHFGLMPPNSPVAPYLDRLDARPARQRAQSL